MHGYSTCIGRSRVKSTANNQDWIGGDRIEWAEITAGSRTGPGGAGSPNLGIQSSASLTVLL